MAQDGRAGNGASQVGAAGGGGKKARERTKKRVKQRCGRPPSLSRSRSPPARLQHLAQPQRRGAGGAGLQRVTVEAVLAVRAEFVL